MSTFRVRVDRCGRWQYKLYPNWMPTTTIYSYGEKHTEKKAKRILTRRVRKEEQFYITEEDLKKK
jgi:hypothetical protein